LSDSRLHDPVAIWVYLEPVFEMIKTNYSSVRIIHFFSDGPTTQYRQKKNLFFFSTVIFQLGFHVGTWNFLRLPMGRELRMV